MRGLSTDFYDRMRSLLAGLPASLEWLVAFDMAGLRDVADQAVLLTAFFIPADIAIPDDAIAVLTEGGRALFRHDATAPVWTDAQDWPVAAAHEPNLLTAYGARLSLLAPHHDLLCIGLGQQGDACPVVMTVARDGSEAALARVALDAMPDTSGYELLAGCGVSFEGARHVGGHVIARFRNRLSAHLTAALASAFVRTANCNSFFLRGVRLDEELAAGLAAAGRGRVRVGARLAQTQAIALALEARRTPMAMTALPPSPEVPVPMGDLVPLGLLLCALNACRADKQAEAAAILLERHLDARRQDGLWSFQSERLVTATDSALVLLGRRDGDAVAALERFADGCGGYLPQLVSTVPEPGRMVRSPETDHWESADLGTTCLVRHLRASAGLPERTPLARLQQRFSDRSALYFANPFLMDWCLALALEGDANAGMLRERLADEVSAAVDDDGGFGRFDRALSTACAILTLAACGRRGRLMHWSQLRLLDLVDDLGHAPVETPFYSTLWVAPAQDPYRMLPGRRGLLQVGEQSHAVTFYRDTFGILGTALRVLALAEPADPSRNDIPPTAFRAARHPRYAVDSGLDYVREIALPPYLTATEAERSAA